MRIPFVVPWMSGRELAYVSEALASNRLAGDGPFCRRCCDLLQSSSGAKCVLVTGSASSALELACLTLDLRPGDEVIMPSFTYPSTANAVALRGAIPVFVDIREDTLNIDESLIEAALTPRTRALAPVHYGGVACEMDRLLEIARRHGLAVIEDAAHAVGAAYKHRALGSIGAMGVLSFHQTKNLTAGEGGALLINDASLVERAEVIWEKGTARRAFSRGEVDHYNWIELGSSFLASEVVAAVLLAQLEALDTITSLRRAAWHRYHAAFEPLERAGLLRRPIVPPGCEHNAHIYYLLVANRDGRDRLIARLQHRGVNAVSHYFPLHQSPAGRRFGRAPSPLPVTERQAPRLLRLPLYAAMGETESLAVIDAVTAELS